MSEQTITERLQPSLLDRLTDSEPSNRTEARDARVIDLRRLREIVQRDLSWLLNTNDNGIDPGRYPYASRSVLNFGVREVAGEYSTNQRVKLIRESITRAISVFEPRISAGTLDVVLRDETNDRSTVVYFDIRAEMWAQPLPIELYLRSEVDITTGELKLERKG